MTPYYESERGALYHGDVLEIMPRLSEEASLICIDPPYNIGKDTWDKIPDYQAWMGKVFLECQRLLADNGSFYWFHNKIPVINRLMIWLEENTEFIFKQMIVWNKRFKGASNKKFLDGFIETNQLRNYQLMAEYCLFYTFQDEKELATKNPFCEILKDARSKAELTIRQVAARGELHGKVNHGGAVTNWETGANIPLKEQWEKLKTFLPIRKEYEDLRKEYEDLRYAFNNQKTHHSVWNYEIAPKIGHITPKPIALIENILKHSSNPGDLVIDLFGGSGTTAVACENLKRRWILCEKEEKYCEISAKRIEVAASQTTFEDYL